MATTQEIHAPKLGAPGESCWSCSVPLAEDQRYCLNCGERRTDPRLPFDTLFGGSAASPPTPPPVDRTPVSPSGGLPLNATTGAFAAGLLLLSLLVGVVIGSSGDRQVEIPAQKPPVVNVTGGGASAATPVSAEFVSDWPGEDGWTVQLKTIPKEGSDAAAIAAAKQEATASGATEVGALDSDEYASLDSGAYVIYSGVYTSKKDATAALKDLKTSFPDAKVVEVSVTAPEEAAADKSSPDEGQSSKEAAKDLEKLSGDRYVKETQKAKDDVDVLGPPPGSEDTGATSPDAEASPDDTSGAGDQAGGGK
jgi:hypothetical protein